MPIRRALLSVSDKTGLVDFAQALVRRGVIILSTGGTYNALKKVGLPISTVESYTGSPEVMEGRVKTLHPRVHGGILARAQHDEEDLERLGASFIDLIAVNLYPFEATLAKAGASCEELIENIDIGGPSMLRSAAKNHARVTVVCDPSDYPLVIQELSARGEVSTETRERLAGKAFSHTAAYDAAIAGWLTSRREPDGYPGSLALLLEKGYGLRYGENPHQSAAFYRDRNAAVGSLARAESLGTGAKELSYNNLVDVDAALDAVREYTGPAAVVVKHATPCGAAIAQSLSEAYRLARGADSVSAYGGIVALNQLVDAATADILMETFLECIVAPRFEAAALDRLRSKKNLRLLATGEWLAARSRARQFKRIDGGFVVQEHDDTGPREVIAGKVVTARAPTEAELQALEFGWRVVKHVRSNAIVLAKAGPSPDSCVTVAIGGGQTSRVSSVQIACRHAGEAAQGAVLASDAFFPFPDGLEVAAQAGVTAAAQPGGSVHDAEVIATANANKIAMVFTGVRHFRH